MTLDTIASSPGRSFAARWAAFTRQRPMWSGHAAAVWSAAYGLLGLLWALGAGGFPFGAGDPEARDMTSLLVGVRAETAGPVIATLGGAGAVLALAAARSRHRPAIRAALTGWAWLVCGVLVFLVPDVRLVRDFAYSFVLNFDKVDWPTINQLICVAGGLLWGAVAVALQRRAGPTSAAQELSKRDRSWERWGPRATLAAVLLPVPYEVVRWAWSLGIPLGVTTGAAWIEHATTQARIGMFVLGLLPLLGGILTHGLVRPWGQTYPRWVPRKAGRRIHPAVGIVPGTIASVLIITAGLCIYREQLNALLGRVPDAHPDVEGWGAWLPAWFWLPWGIALATATYSYHRRRAASRRGGGLDLRDARAVAHEQTRQAPTDLREMSRDTPSVDVPMTHEMNPPRPHARATTRRRGRAAR